MLNARATAPKSAFFEGFSDPTSGFSKPFQPLATAGGKKELASAMIGTNSQSNKAENREFGAVALVEC